MSRVLIVTPSFHGYGDAIAHALDAQAQSRRVRELGEEGFVCM